MPVKGALKPSVKPSEIHISDVEILHAELKSVLGFDPELIESYEVQSDLDMAFNLVDKMTKAELKLSINSVSAADTDQEEASAHFHLVFLFHVENLDELTEVMDDDTITLKGGLGNAISSITYSTSRGILLTRFQGTALRKFILPVVDPNDLV